MNCPEPLHFVMTMGTRAKAPPTQPRFSYARVAQEIQAFLDRKRGNQADCARALGMDSGTFRHTMNEREGARFSIEQLSIIAEVANAPAGWPWLSWTEAEEFQAYMRLSPAAREVLRAAAGRAGPLA